MAADTAVKVEKVNENRVWIVRLHRPAHRNAVDGATAAKLHEAFVKFERDPDALVAVLYGDGGVFCAGADLQAIAKGGIDAGANPIGPPSGDILDLGPMGPTRMQLSKPVIAAIQGFAVAGGLELACWADLRVCDESAVFGVFCRRFGVPLIDGGTIRLPRIVGQGRALDMILTGRPVAAQEALQFGLANRVVPRGEALKGALELASSLCEFPQACMRNDRASSLDQWSLPLKAALGIEFAVGIPSVIGASAREGARAFKQGKGRGGVFSKSSRL